MSNTITIFKRDLAAYFTSAIGYIFMVVFVLIGVGLYITTFFTFPLADMRAFFANIPIMLCVFIPAVTMRVWAEERKENTWEMLLTFPMRARELVLGKFLACFVFYLITLAATFTIPLMLATLGNPDQGAIFGGYLGSVLLGAYFLALGIFISGFCKDQIVAFVLSLLVFFGIFLLGTGYVAYLDNMIPGLGAMLSQLLAFSNHFTAFTRGVIEVADILYFVAWTAIFLLLNMAYIEQRNRPGTRLNFALSVAILLAIGFAANWAIMGQSLGRADLTEDKIYTVSDATERILGDLEKPVQVTLYITPRDKMPAQLATLEQDVEGKLQEIRAASGGAIDVKTIHLEAANVVGQASMPGEEQEGAGEEDEERLVEERMLDKGVRPFSVQALSQDEVTSKLIYSSIGVGYLDREEEIIPEIVPQVLPELEYRLVSTIYKLTREERPVVALVAPKEAVNIPPQVRQMYEQMGQPVPTTEDPYVYLEQILTIEKYDVRRVDMTQESPLPENYDTLVVVNPRELNERQRWELNRALYSGKSVVLAAQHYQWDYRIAQRSLSVSKRSENPQINPLLEQYGLGINEDVLMDVNHVPLTVQSSANPLQSMLGGGTTVNFPTHILVHNETMDQETSVTSRISNVFYLWGSALNIDQDKLQRHGLEWNVLMETSDKAWMVPHERQVTSMAYFDEPENARQAYPLMAMVTGQFPDAYQGQSRPSWPAPQPRPGQPPISPPPEEGEAAPVDPAPGKLILMGASVTFRRSFLQGANLDLFLNSVDAVTLGDDIVQVRGRKPIDRTIETPPPGTRQLWKLVNYGLAPAIIIAAGVITFALRKRSRNAYTMAYALAD